jgi:glycosyltransferase involved in cell wall biosynthesis
MKLVASLIARNELDRYLPTVIAHLAEFCDEIRVLDDFSVDGTYEWLLAQDAVSVRRNEESAFFVHEGHARQALLDWTLAASPTHVLAIDADELVSDGAALRRSIASASAQTRVWMLSLVEVWRAEPEHLLLRTDNAWRPRRVPLLYHAPPGRAALKLKIRDRALACGREPEQVRAFLGRPHRIAETGVELLHLGWANEAARLTRHQRYAEHDGGNFHQKRHLDSILWPDSKVRLTPRPWPAALLPYREEILDAASPKVAV